ncbi:MAG: hypothetical protein HY074_13570 [Deltaproteobacteria bacterium]|nr:hypothetical protein [Deltaproteobacteria bacterium]
MTAWFNGFLGVILVYAIASLRLGLTEFEAALCVIASNVSGMVSLLLYSAAFRRPWIRKRVIGGPFRTWTLFLTAYFGFMLLMAPALRDPEHFKWLAIPVIMTTGFTILIFGPIQDRMVARSQRK